MVFTYGQRPIHPDKVLFHLSNTRTFDKIMNQSNGISLGLLGVFRPVVRQSPFSDRPPK